VCTFLLIHLALVLYSFGLFHWRRKRQIFLSVITDKF
jgi:hypothetical protein